MVAREKKRADVSTDSLHRSSLERSWVELRNPVLPMTREQDNHTA